MSLLCVWIFFQYTTLMIPLAINMIERVEMAPKNAVDTAGCCCKACPAVTPGKNRGVSNTRCFWEYEEKTPGIGTRTQSHFASSTSTVSLFMTASHMQAQFLSSTQD